MTATCKIQVNAHILIFDTPVANCDQAAYDVAVEKTSDSLIGERWLLLFHQLPAKPPYFRVKIWRRMQAIGAVSIKNAVYALPNNEQTQEDFAWVHKEVIEGGGEAVIC